MERERERGDRASPKNQKQLGVVSRAETEKTNDAAQLTTCS
jgi:hypothetical protein